MMVSEKKRETLKKSREDDFMRDFMKDFMKKIVILSASPVFSVLFNYNFLSCC